MSDSCLFKRYIYSDVNMFENFVFFAKLGFVVYIYYIVVFETCFYWMPIPCGDSCTLFFRTGSSFQKSICIILFFGAVFEDVYTQMTQNTIFSHTKQDAGIAVWETIYNLGQDL